MPVQRLDICNEVMSSRPTHPTVSATVDITYGILPLVLFVVAIMAFPPPAGMSIELPGLRVVPFLAACIIPSPLRWGSGSVPLRDSLHDRLPRSLVGRGTRPTIIPTRLASDRRRKLTFGEEPLLPGRKRKPLHAVATSALLILIVHSLSSLSCHGRSFPSRAACSRRSGRLEPLARERRTFACMGSLIPDTGTETVLIRHFTAGWSPRDTARNP